MAKAPPWFPWYPSDYDGGTQHLDLIEDHVYRRLLDQQWILGGRLPSSPERLFALVPKLRMGRSETAARKLFTKVWARLQDEKSAEDLPVCPGCGIDLLGSLPVYCVACSSRLRSPKFEQDRRGFFNQRLDEVMREAIESISTSAIEGYRGSLTRWGCSVKKGGCGLRGLTGEEKSCPRCGLDLWKDFNPPRYDTVFSPPKNDRGASTPPNSPPNGSAIPSIAIGTASTPAELAASSQLDLNLSVDQQVAEAQPSAPARPRGLPGPAPAASRGVDFSMYEREVEEVFRGATGAKTPLTITDREVLRSYAAQGVPAQVLGDRIRHLAAREEVKRHRITSFRYVREPDGGALEEAAVEWREGHDSREEWTDEDLDLYRAYAVGRVKSGLFAVETEAGDEQGLVHPDMLERSLRRLEKAHSVGEIHSVLQVLASTAEKAFRRAAQPGVDYTTSNSRRKTTGRR